VIRGPGIRALAAILLNAVPVPAHGAGVPARAHDPRAVLGAATVAPARRDARPLHATPADSLARFAVAFGRALDCDRRGDARGVADVIGALPFGARPASSDAEPAAFLLAQTWLRLGEREHFERLADAVAAWPASSATRWIALERALLGTSHGPAGDSLLLAAAAAEPALARDRDAAARISEANRAMAEGRDPDPILARVPAASRYTARAQHLRGLAALERGDAARGEALLASAFADTSYGARRELGLAIAGDALDHERWGDALAAANAVDHDWNAQREALLRLHASGGVESVWAAWAASPDSAATLVLDPTATLARAFALADGLGGADAALPEPVFVATPASGAPAPRVELPAAERWQAVATLSRACDEARGELARAQAELAAEQASLADRRRYVALGRDSLARADARMAPHAVMLDSLREMMQATDRQLRNVRDEEAARVGRRTALLLRASEAQAAWAEALRRLYVSGPDSARYGRAPDGLPSAVSTLARERALTASVQALASQIAAAAPGWLARSYEQKWSPRLIDRALEQADEIDAQRAFAHVLGVSLDSSLAGARTSEALAALQRRVPQLERRADSLAAANEALRASVAREAIARTLADLPREREGIDYVRAAALYALAVRLDASDSALAAIRAGRTAPDTSSEAAESPEAARWRTEALPVLRAFLSEHPRSAARGEVRFRLADLELTQARQDFRARMAEFVRRTAEGRGAGQAVPVIDPSRALALYRQILAEDRDFPHLDAVRFNAGMILADSGESGAEAFFAELVATAPGSPYAPEAWLRMGDMAFDARRWAEAASRYAHAAEGPDATLDAIALYKRGWAFYNQDRYDDAADAFRAVLDLDAAKRGDVHVDIESEANAYLVYALAGAGGAPALVRAAERSGAREYDVRVALALGQQYRAWGRYADAAAVDRLVLDRWPDSSEALLAAQREVETWRRAGEPAREREAALALAPRFAPGGEWYGRQSSDSLKSAGESFAHDTWLSVAREQHARARTSGAAADWKQALDSYAAVLARWPHDADADALELAAGESATHLDDFPGALAWYAAAARDGRDSSAAIALLQRVAVTDTWYERTRGRDATGSDSLAKEVLAAGDALLSRFPAHPRAADVTWRQSQLALAHGWLDRAGADLGRFASAHPDDHRAPLAATERGDVLFRAGRFDDAVDAFGGALTLARAHGADSLARRAAAAQPVCAYRAAEAAVAADSNAFAAHAERFEKVATQWPTYALAPLAEYRAGVAFGRAKRDRDEVRVLAALLQRWPGCTYAGDARLRIAQALEEQGDRTDAADAWLAFSRGSADAADAGTAWLKAADLLAADGQPARADTLRLEYVRRHPGDVESAMAIYEALARRDLEHVDAAHPVSKLLGAPARSHSRHVAPPAPPASHLASYLLLASAHPALGSRDVIAQVRFLEAEESNDAYAAARLTQPLARSVQAKKTLLDTLLVRYRRAADQGVPLWAHAAGFRMGEALEGFADALRTSEPPANLKGDDLAAYRNVLAERSTVFSSRGEEVWTELLRKLPEGASADAWTRRAREALYPRLAHRFLFRPEVDFPLVDAEKHEMPAAVASADTASREHHGGGLLAWLHLRHRAELPPAPVAVVTPRAPAPAEDPRDPSPAFERARALANADSLAAAEAPLRASLAIDSTYAPALALLSRLYWADGRHADALDLLAPVLRNAELWPASSRAALLAGLALHEAALGQAAPARTAIAAAMAADERTAAPASVYLALSGEAADSVGEAAREVAHRDGRSAANQNNLGIARLRAGDPEGAKQAFEAASERDPKLPGPWYDLAILEKFWRFDDDAATRAFSAYWRRSHDDPDALYPIFAAHLASAAATKGDQP
jgi:hypothetical protein